MSKILNHPFYKASKQLEEEIINDIDSKLSLLTNTYIPSDPDRKMFFAYGDKYVLLSSVNYFHPQFFFYIGTKIIEKTTEHELRIGVEICKESVYAIMAMCAVLKNDILNYRIYLERMLEQRQLYVTTPASLIDLINNEPVFGSVKREANRVFNDNSVVQKFQSGLFADINFTTTSTTLSLFHQKQFVTYILNYRLLHYSLDKTNCPDIVFEQCYSLIQNLCVLIESNLKEKKASTLLLWPLLTTYIDEPYKSTLSTTLTLKARFKTNNISTFNTNLPLVIAELDACTNPEQIICYCFYIAYMCRNQVLHNVTDVVIFHNDGIVTEKLIGILLSTVHFVSKV